MLLSLFLLVMLVLFDFYVFAFLAEKFAEFAIQHVIYVIACSELIGYVVFTLFLTRARRRVLNFTVSGGVLAVSVVMLLASLALDKQTVDTIGLVSVCKCLYVAKPSFFQNSGGVRVRLLFPVHGRAVPFSRARRHDGSADPSEQHEQCGHSVPGYRD